MAIGKRISAALVVLACGLLPGPGRTRAEELRVLLPSEFATLDPVEILSGDQTMVMYHVYCRLYTFDDQMNPVPDLVAEEKLSPDQRTWTLRLKQGARFHDGTPVGAEVVKYTIERMRQKGGSQKALFAPIKEIRVAAPDTVVLTTEQPFPSLRNSLAHPNAGLVSAKADAALGDKYGVQPVSCGPYVFQEWARGSRISVVRNDAFYGPRPEYDRITFQFVPDVSTRLFMMMRKEADLALRLGPAEAKQLEAAKGKVVRVAGRNIFYQLNYTLPPTGDLRVREAINYAVDKEAIIQRVLQGAGTPARSVLEAMTWGSIPVGTYKYDPERARALLKEAGLSNPKIVLLSPDNRYLLDSQTSQAVAGYLKAVGFDVDLRVIGDWAGYVDTLKKRAFNLFMLGWGSSTGDPDQVLQSLFSSQRAGQAWNYGAYANKEIDELTKEARSTFDEAKRKAIYADIQKRLFADAPWLFMYRGTTFTAVGEKVKTLHTLEGPEFHYVFPLPKG
jgi:peptide/nickel transport system substrate-binding protein